MNFSTSAFPAAAGCALQKSSGLFAEPLATDEMTRSDLALQAISKILIIFERQDDSIIFLLCGGYRHAS